MSHTDPEFEARLRRMLQRAASPVQPDPAGWRRLDARITRRRRARRAGGLALAGAAAAIVAVGIITTTGQDQRVELAPADTAPADLASRPGATEPSSAVPLPPEPSTRPVVAGGIVFSDGSSIHVADLDGTTRSTPAALGVSNQTITDLDVRPGGTTTTFTAVYRVDGRSDGDGGCGDIAWFHVPHPDEIGTGDVLPRAGAQAENCLGAPVFASDGSALLWFAELATGGVALQAIDWSDDGPAAGSLVTWPLDVSSDPSALRLVSVRMPSTGAESGTHGTVVVRAPTPDGPALHSLPIQRQGDGALALTGPWAPVPVRADVRLDPVLAVDGGWELGRPAGDELQGIVDDDSGLAYAYLHRTTPTGDPIEPGLSATSTLTWEPGQPLYLDAIGDTAVMGNGGPMHLAIIRDGTDRMHTALPVATAAALLAGDGTAVDPSPEPVAPATELLPAPPIPSPTPEAATSPAATPSPTPTAVRTETARPADPAATPPQAVRDTAQAIRQAAQARDWAAIDALIPDNGFTSNFGGREDHVAYYQDEESRGTDVLGIIAGLLAEAPATEDGAIWVWPVEYYGPEYEGWRVGIRADGTWIFYVAGD